MTKEDLNTILELLHKYPDYLDDKAVFCSYIEQYEKNPSKVDLVWADLVSYINRKNLPRRKVFGLLFEISQDWHSKMEYPEHLDNFISNHLDGLCYDSWLYIKNPEPDMTEIRAFNSIKMDWDWIKEEYWLDKW